MSTKYIASNWRLPNQENSSKNDNYGLTFDGSSERIEIPFTKLNGATNCTISFWAKINYSVDSEPKYPLTLTSGTDYDIMWNFGANGTTLDVYIGNLNFRLDGSFNNDIDEWNHWVLRFDGSQSSGNRTKIYQNGQQLTSQAGWGTATSIPTASHLIIGGRNLGSTAWYYQFPGSISDISIFDYTLSESQISTLYGSSSLGSGNPMILNPVAYYPLGDNSASNPLTQPNVAVEDASVFDFEGDDKIDINEVNSVFSNASNFTISGWFNWETISNANEWLFMASGTNINTKRVQIETYNQDLYFSFIGATGSLRVDMTTTQWSGWVHMVAVFDASAASADKMVIYFNGARAANVAYTEPTGNSPTDIVNVSIGNRTDGLYNFEGQISNFQIWNLSLLSSEITTLYNNGVPLYTGTQPQAANLKSWYKLNNTANWEADSSGNWQIPEATSAYPQSFNFDAYNSNPKKFIEVSRDVVNVTNAICVSGWVKTQRNTSQRQTIISNYESTDIAQNGCWFFEIGDGWSSGYTKMRFGVRPASESNVFVVSQTSGQVITDNKWHHVLALWDGTTTTNAVKIFVDGLLAGQGTATAAAPIKTAIDSRPSIGKSAADSSGLYGNGNYLGGNAGQPGFLSNVQVWDTTLTYGTVNSIGDTAGGQVAQLYNNGTPLTNAIATDNLKGWWKLNDNEKFDGTNWSVENQKYPAGFDSALDFDGSSDYIDCGNDSSLSPSNFTLSVWAKSDLSNGSWISKYASENYGFGIYGGSIFLNIKTSAGWGGLSLTASSYLTANNWHHIVGTYDETDLKIYVDGNLAGTLSKAGPITYSSRDTRIGNLEGTSSLDFNGEISNAAIFNTVLDSTAVTALYNNGTPETSISSSPVSWWKLDNTTTGIQDSTGSNDGTNNGATKVNTFVSTEAATSSGMTEQNLVNNNVSTLNGESSGMTSANLVTSDLTRAIPYGDGYSFNFDSASSDYIDTGQIDITADKSISLWIYPTASGNNGGVFTMVPTGGQTDLLSIALWQSNIQVLTAHGVRQRSLQTISINTWYHIVVVKETNLITKIYINGVDEALNSSGAWNGTPNNPQAKIGEAAFGGTGYNFDGKISNLSIFNEKLTSTEVLKLYSNGVPQDLSSFTPQPIAWYPLGSNSFWNGSTWTVRDMSAGGSNDGTSANIGADGLVGDAPRSEANGTGTNMDVPSNLEGNTKWSSNNSYSVNMSSEARKQDTP